MKQGRYRGKVKWFCPEKGYGFILIDDSDEEVFVHFSHLNEPGFKILNVDEEVEFDLKDSARGYSARNVVRINSERTS